MGMHIAMHWRLRSLRYGNPEAWNSIVVRNRENNPRLPWAVLASNLARAQIDQIHENIKGREEIVWQRDISEG